MNKLLSKYNSTSFFIKKGFQNCIFRNVKWEFRLQSKAHHKHYEFHTINGFIFIYTTTEV